MNERFGHASLKRPDGKLIWVHAASIGEMNAVLPLIKTLEGQRLSVLLTTMTKTASDIAASRNLRHQFIPYDSPLFMRRFYNHWQPDLIILTEQEIWINLIRQATAPIIIINGRLSEKSFLNWNKFLKTAKAVFNKVTLVLAQSEKDAERFSLLGAKTESVGNLKFDSLSLKRPRHLTRKTWLAASTHEGEELMAARIHLELTKQFPDLLTLICPRHAERGGEIAKALNHLNLLIHQRSKQEEITTETDIYILDTYGELSDFYPLSPITFMGKSIHGEGGQNPIEAIMAGSCVITGDKFSNFQTIFTSLKQSKGVEIVQNEVELQAKLLQLLLSNEDIKSLNINALLAVIESRGALAKTLSKIEGLLK